MVSGNVKDAHHKAAHAADSGASRSTHAMPSRGKKVNKKNSDARKEQNRNASRAYRERRKQRLALLGELLDRGRTQGSTGSPNDTHPSETQPDAPHLQPEEVARTAETCRPVDHETNGPSFDPASQSLPSPPSPAGNIGGQSALLTCEDLSFDSPWPIPLNDNLSSYVLLRAAAASESLPSAAGPLALGPPSSLNPPDERALGVVPFVTPQDPQTPQSQPLDVVLPPPSSQSLSWPAPSSRQTSSSFSALGQLLQLLDEQPALRDGDSSKPTSSSPSATTRDESLGLFLEHLMSLRAPTVPRAIYVQQNSLYAAVMDNTLAIGCLQGMQLMMSDEGTSPFFNKDCLLATARGSNDSNKIQQLLLSQVKSQFATAPKALQPVDEQITMDHHVYLDVVPFPSFRRRALTALAQDPPLFDEDELCVDISDRSGLVVWGSLGNDQGMEACRSWDMRSWEPQPWFLRKYWFLVGGWDDDMWKAARWWHGMRNERIGTGPPR